MNSTTSDFDRDLEAGWPGGVDLFPSVSGVPASVGSGVGSPSASVSRPGVASLPKASSLAGSTPGVHRAPEGSLPPSCNTGVEATSEEKMIGWDWLAFTVLPETGWSLDHVLQFLTPEGESLDSWFESRGHHGYRKSHIRGEYRVYSDGFNPSMGIWVQLSGVAINQLICEFKLNNESSWKNWLQYLVDNGFKFTRVDGCIDLFNKSALDLDLIEEFVKNRSLVTCFHRYQGLKSESIDISKDYKGGGLVGRTLRFGSRESLEMIRIYDKKAQTGEKFQFEWTRIEIEFKKESAVGAIQAFLKHGFAVIPAAIKAKLDFKNPDDDDTNRSRRDTVAWWDEALSYTEKMRVRVGRSVARTYDDVKKWLVKQCSPSLSFVADCIYKECKVSGLDYRSSLNGFLYSLIEEGRGRRSGRLESLLKSYLPGVVFGCPGLGL